MSTVNTMRTNPSTNRFGFGPMLMLAIYVSFGRALSRSRQTPRGPTLCTPEVAGASNCLWPDAFETNPRYLLQGTLLVSDLGLTRKEFRSVVIGS